MMNIVNWCFRLPQPRRTLTLLVMIWERWYKTCYTCWKTQYPRLERLPPWLTKSVNLLPRYVLQNQLIFYQGMSYTISKSFTKVCPTKSLHLLPRYVLRNQLIYYQGMSYEISKSITKVCPTKSVNWLPRYVRQNQ